VHLLAVVQDITGNSFAGHDHGGQGLPRLGQIDGQEVMDLLRKAFLKQQGISGQTGEGVVDGVIDAEQRCALEILAFRGRIVPWIAGQDMQDMTVEAGGLAFQHGIALVQIARGIVGDADLGRIRAGQAAGGMINDVGRAVIRA